MSLWYKKKLVGLGNLKDTCESTENIEDYGVKKNAWEAYNTKVSEKVDLTSDYI